MTAASSIRELTAYCKKHRCATCPMNDVLPPKGQADLCVVSLAIEKLEQIQKSEASS
jgi:hypothetical protein